MKVVDWVTVVCVDDALGAIGMGTGRVGYALAVGAPHSSLSDMASMEAIQ